MILTCDSVIISKRLRITLEMTLQLILFDEFATLKGKVKVQKGTKKRVSKLS